MNRELLFKGKRLDNGEWTKGAFIYIHNRAWIIETKYAYACTLNKYGININPCYIHEIQPDTLSQFTSIFDNNGNPIFENDIVQYTNAFCVDIISVVCFGEYIQDGSSGEYCGATCVGWYLKIVDFIRPNWDDEYTPRKYEYTQSLFESKEYGLIVTGSIIDANRNSCNRMDFKE